MEDSEGWVMEDPEGWERRRSFLPQAERVGRVSRRSDIIMQEVAVC